jgi:hypothetical protein
MHEPFPLSKLMDKNYTQLTYISLQQPITGCLSAFGYTTDKKRRKNINKRRRSRKKNKTR